MPNDCDPCLIRRLRAGDDLAFDLLHARYRPQLLRHAERLLGRANASAEDVVQDAMIRAHRAMLADQREIDVAPWLHTNVRHRALDELRRAGAHPVAAAPAVDLPSGRPGPHAIAVQHEQLREIGRDLAALPPRQRLAFAAVVAGHPHTDVARALGVQAGASKTLVQRARVSLRTAARAREQRAAA